MSVLESFFFLIKPFFNTILAVVLSDIPIFIRAGHIIALSELERDNISTHDLSQFSIYLVIALKCDQRNRCTSSGELKFTKNFSLIFKATEKQLEINTNIASPNKIEEMCTENLFPKLISHANIYGMAKSKNNSKKLNLNFCTSDLSKSIIYSF